MKIYSILDDIDIAVGMNLSGIHSIVLDKEQSVNNKIDETLKNEQVGILVLSKNIYARCKEKIDNIIKKEKMPLVVILDK